MQGSFLCLRLAGIVIVAEGRRTEWRSTECQSCQSFREVFVAWFGGGAPEPASMRRVIGRPGLRLRRGFAASASHWLQFPDPLAPPRRRLTLTLRFVSRPTYADGSSVHVRAMLGRQGPGLTMGFVSGDSSRVGRRGPTQSIAVVSGSADVRNQRPCQCNFVWRLGPSPAFRAVWSADRGIGRNSRAFSVRKGASNASRTPMNARDANGSPESGASGERRV